MLFIEFFETEVQESKEVDELQFLTKGLSLYKRGAINSELETLLAPNKTNHVENDIKGIHTDKILIKGLGLSFENNLNLFSIWL
ncbi:hypothetical protein OAL60_00235 [bacterium]|nr:hypothetical protein [bacterium]